MAQRVYVPSKKEAPLENGISKFIPPTPLEKRVEQRRRVERDGGSAEEHPIGDHPVE